MELLQFVLFLLLNKFSLDEKRLISKTLNHIANLKLLKGSVHKVIFLINKMYTM